MDGIEQERSSAQFEKVEMAKRMWQKGVPLETILEVTGLSAEELE